MDLRVVIIYSSLILNDFSVGENAESLAVRNQKQHREPGILINKIMPQKMYAVPSMITKVNPAQLNIRLDNGLNNIPKFLIPVGNQQKNSIPSSVTGLKEPKPIFTENIHEEASKGFKVSDPPTVHESTVPVTKSDSVNKKPKKMIQQVKEAKPNDIQTKPLKKLDQGNPKHEDTKTEKPNKPTHDTKLKAKSQNEDIEIDFDTERTKKPHKLNEEQIEGTKSAKHVVTEKDTQSVHLKENKNIEVPKNETQSKDDVCIKDSTPRTQFDPDNEKTIANPGETNAKDTIPIQIPVYKLEDIIHKYTRSPINFQVYSSGTDFSINQPRNLVIKNHNIEELCETSPDIQHESEQQYCYNNERPPYQTYYPQYGYDIPRPQDVVYNSYDSKDRIWRNWKTTEIYISKCLPEFTFNNEYDHCNGFNTPIINGDSRYSCYKENIPFQQAYA